MRWDITAANDSDAIGGPGACPPGGAWGCTPKAMASEPGERFPRTGSPHERADDGIRTRDPHLGKVMRYQLRYVRMLMATSIADGLNTLCRRPYDAVGWAERPNTFVGIAFTFLTFAVHSKRCVACLANPVAVGMEVS